MRPEYAKKEKQTRLLLFFVGGAYPIKCPTLFAALCIACSVLFAACCTLRRTEGFIIAPAAIMETTAPATAPVAMPETKGETRIFCPPPFKKIVSWIPLHIVCPPAAQTYAVRAEQILYKKTELFCGLGCLQIAPFTI